MLGRESHQGGEPQTMDVSALQQKVAAMPPWWLANHRNVRLVLGEWLAAGDLPEESIPGADILDFGGGQGALATLLLERGARSVTVIDPSLSLEFYRVHFGRPEGLALYKGAVQQFAAEQVGPAGGLFDMVVALSVTEHVIDLAQCLYTIRDLIRPGGFFFTAHDNYYQPGGAHDDIVTYGDRGCDYYGPRCWESPELCEASREFRTALALNPSCWTEVDERSRTPHDCRLCPFFKRARPWAHLVHADAFPRVFQNDFFSTGRPGSGLNKITPFQLKQFIVEAGFDLEVWRRNTVPNDPPPELLADPHWHNPADLKTLNIIARARRGAER